MRQFEDKPAKREATPLLVGLVGSSGSGKTFSALRLASGIQRVSGGEIWCIDTEARRALHYADQFTFRHMEFKSPFGPLDYLAAVEHCANKGAKIIIVDSTSHEHEGPGGVLEMHESEMDRLAVLWKSSPSATTFAAWQKPKAERRKLLNSILQMPINFIFCFRAKEKTKQAKDNTGKTVMVPLGFMPIAGDEFVYEMTLNVLLLPGSDGVPTWQPTEVGEKAMIKLPAQFRAMLADRQPLSEATGEKLASWAAGGVSAQPAQSMPAAPQAQPVNRQPAPVAKAPEPAPEGVADDYSNDTPPACGTCHQPMRLHKAGVGKIKSSFWGCPNWKTCPGAKATISASKWRDELMDKQANHGADAFDFANDDAEEPPRQYPD